MAGYLAPKAVVCLALMSTRPSHFYPAKDVLEPHYVASHHLAEDLLHLIE
jgi:hypothetical protein